MTPQIVTVAPDVQISRWVRQMLDAGVRHRAVVDGDEIVGVISMRDLLAVLADETDHRA